MTTHDQRVLLERVLPEAECFLGSVDLSRRLRMGLPKYTAQEWEDWCPGAAGMGPWGVARCQLAAIGPGSLRYLTSWPGTVTTSCQTATPTRPIPARHKVGMEADLA